MPRKRNKKIEDWDIWFKDLNKHRILRREEFYLYAEEVQEISCLALLETDAHVTSGSLWAYNFPPRTAFSIPGTGYKHVVTIPIYNQIYKLKGTQYYLYISRYYQGEDEKTAVHWLRNGPKGLVWPVSFEEVLDEGLGEHTVTLLFYLNLFV